MKTEAERRGTLFSECVCVCVCGMPKGGDGGDGEGKLGGKAHDRVERSLSRAAGVARALIICCRLEPPGRAVGGGGGGGACGQGRATKK